MHQKSCITFSLCATRDVCGSVLGFQQFSKKSVTVVRGAKYSLNILSKDVSLLSYAWWQSTIFE